MTHPLLARARREGAPLIDGETVTFIWRGPDAPGLLSDVHGWEPEDAVMLAPAAPDLWTYSLTLPRDAYMEYSFVRGAERLPDPLNPRMTPDGLGHINHFFYMPDARPTPLTRRVRGAPHGAVTRHIIRSAWFLVGRQRPVYLYQPPAPEPCPLVVVFDGREYLSRARLPLIVDNLIAQGRIRPVALALVYHAGPARGVEYACSESTVGAVLELVLPLARDRLNLLDAPGVHGVLGASMGGLIALYTAWRAPHVFGHVISQSGAFRFGAGEPVVCDLVRHGPVQPLQVWMDVGRYEWLLEPNRRMHALLAEKGYDVTYREYNGGHNYPSWRNDVAHGLETLFGRMKDEG